jgi:hypothetical protein
MGPIGARVYDFIGRIVVSMTLNYFVIPFVVSRLMNLVFPRTAMNILIVAGAGLG